MKYKLILLAIVLLGLGLRVYRLADNPVSMYWDEAAMAYDAYSISETGKDMHGNNWLQAIYPSYADYKLPLYIWMASLSVKSFGPSVFAVRVVSAMAGTLLIMVGFLLGKCMFNSQKVGLGTALVIAISPWALHFSRVGFEANVAVLCFGLFLWSLFKGLKQPLWLLVSAFFGGLGVYGYFSVRFVVPLVAIWFLILNVKRLSIRHYVFVLLGVVLFGLMMVPIYKSPHYEATNQFRLSTESLINTDSHVMEQNVLRDFSGNSLLSRIFYHRHVLFAKRLFDNMADFLSWSYLFVTGDNNLRHGTRHSGLFGWSMVPFFVWGWVELFRKKKMLAWFFLGAWLMALIPSSIPTVTPHALRSLNALPILALVMGYGLGQLFRMRPRFAEMYSLRGKLRLTATGGLLVLAIAANFLSFWHDYWNHYPSRSAKAWQYGYEQLSDYLMDHYDEYDHFFVTNADDRLYLYVLFFGKIDPLVAQAASRNYRIYEFDKFVFGGVSKEQLSKLPDGSLMVLRADEMEHSDIDLRVKDTLYDYEGEAQYIVIDVGEQRV